MNADAVAALLNEGVEAFRLTREYVGEDLLPAQPGWSWFDWCEKVAALAAAPLPSEPESVYDFAWLIETGQPPRWYGSWATGRDPWTTDATLAVRFPDKADAEAFIAAKDIAGIAVEHGFRRATPLPSDTPADGLDVERLTRALWVVEFEAEEGPYEHASEANVIDVTGLAEAIAHEYAALALTQEPRSGDDR